MAESGINSWHRMGDVGYLDDKGRFWYCGRKSQRVETEGGPLFTECVEVVFNKQPGVRRAALVGIGPRGGQTPAVVIERDPTRPEEDIERTLIQRAQSHEYTRAIGIVLFHPQLPVDVRHNAKINREVLAKWAAKRLRKNPSPLTPDT